MVCEKSGDAERQRAERLAARRVELADVRSQPPDEALLAGRWIRVFCDYCADGLWSRDGIPLHPGELPLPDDLAMRILAWQDDYDYAPEPDGFEDSVFYLENGPPEMVEPFGAKGFAIASDIKRHLPDWTVIYFDARRTQQRNYEITDEVLKSGAPPVLPG